jgi:hypothetical protein
MRFTNTASFLASLAILAVMLLPAAQQAGSNKGVKQRSAAPQPAKKAGVTASAAHSLQPLERANLRRLNHWGPARRRGSHGAQGGGGSSGPV